MEVKLSTRAFDVLSFSGEEALRLGNDYVGVEHLLLGILRDADCGAIKLLKHFDVNLKRVKKNIETAIRSDNTPLSSADAKDFMNKQPVNKQLEKTIKYAFLLSKNYKCTVIKTEHFLLAILKDIDNVASMFLGKESITYNNVKRIMEISQNNDTNNDDMSEDKNLDNIDEITNELSNEDDDIMGGDSYSSSTPKKGADPKSTTPVLDSFGRDLTRMAEDDKLDPIVGRDKELERIAQILSRRKKNNPILIGEPGVGKSAIAEGLAIRIMQRKVPRSLFNKRVVTLDLASLVAGTKYRGQFEERMKAVLKEIEKNEDIIMFIDEIHTIVGRQCFWLIGCF